MVSVRSHPLPLDASCCSEAAADAIRTAAAAAVAEGDELGAVDATAGSKSQLNSNGDRALQEQQFENEQLQQVRTTCSTTATHSSSNARASSACTSNALGICSACSTCRAATLQCPWKGAVALLCHTLPHSDALRLLPCRSQELQQLQQQLASTAAQLQTAHADLARDEEIFAERVREAAQLRDEQALLVAAAERERRDAARQTQQLRADLRR